MARKKKNVTPASPAEFCPPADEKHEQSAAQAAEEVAAEPMPAEEEDAPQASLQAEQTPESDPYTPYRYRWEAGQVEKRRVDYRKLTVLCVSVILALGLVALSITAYFLENLPLDTSDPGSASEGTVVLQSVAPKQAQDALSVQEMIRAVSPAVVGIDVTNQDATTGVASGLIVHEDGYIVTNRHVVASAASITVHTEDGGSYVASVIGSDELSDIAVLRIRGEAFSAAVLGDSSQVQQGDWVVAIGTPGGLEFSSSATLGIVSGTQRKVQMQGAGESASKTYTVIQTDASINPGNSGGPLVNVYGQVIGINSMKLSTDSYESIGFALPINGVISVANQIIETGRVEARPEEDYVVGGTVFGATFEYFSALSAKESGLVSGAYVKTVDALGPAETAGVKMGDIITSFDGQAVTSLSVITETLSRKQAGEVITIELYRDRAPLTLQVTLAAYQGK